MRIAPIIPPSLRPAARQLRRGLRRARRELAERARGTTRRPDQATPGADGSPQTAGATASSAATAASTVTWERLVAGGAGIHAATMTKVRELISEGRANEAVSVGYSLLTEPGSAELGRLVLGVCRHQSSDAALAWRDLGEVTTPALIAEGGEEWFAVAFEQDPRRAAAALNRVMDEGLHARWDGTRLVRVARWAFLHGELDLTRALIEEGCSRTDGTVSASLARELKRLATWLPEGAQRRPVPTMEADVRFGVLNYRQPDYSSRNVGDWIQTLASMGHLVRHRNLTFVGDDDELVTFTRGLADQTRPNRRLDGTADATVQLVEVQRDAMPYQQLPDRTWVLGFGWYMHPTFGQHYSFPFPEQVRPIFISFHLNKPDMLDDAAVDYLRRHGPVGCRDWQTVVALRDVGVPAFFSGCMTTTVDTVIPEGMEGTRTRVGYVDHPRQDEGEVIEQTITGLRGRSFAANLRTAQEWVTSYAHDYRKVYTSRLHCNLPARSVGCEVEFNPKNRSDVRFGGLIDIDDEAFEAIRQGILDKLAGVLELILAGADDEAVYARWRELCAPAMAEADRRLAALGWDLPDEVVPPLLHPGARRVVVVDLAPGEAPRLEGFLRHLAAVVPTGTAVVVSGDESLRSSETAEELTVASGLPVAFVNRTTVPLQDLPRSATTEASARREILLALAVASARDADRVLLLPAASLLREDLTPLFDLDLQGHPVAAPRDPRRSRRLGAALARGVSSRQGADAAGALAFLAGASATLAPRSVPFDPVVLVVDPEALATAGGGLLVPLMARYGASFREALNVVLGDRRLELPERWATLVHLQTPLDDAAVLSYRVGTRPWSDQVTVGQQEWRSAAG